MRYAKRQIRRCLLKPQASSPKPGFPDGFTIVELLIVVAILALAAVALVGVTIHIQTQGDVALTKQSVQLLSAAVAQFYDITGHYPVDDWTNRDDDGSRIYGANSSGTPKPDELLYLQLSLLPQTRKIIAKLPDQLLAKPHDDITVTLGGQQTPYLRSIVDPWHTEDDHRPLRYIRNVSSVGEGFPTIRSDGPDGESTSAADKLDDISNED